MQGNQPVLQNSMSLENFNRDQRRASRLGAVTVNTTHNVCSYDGLHYLPLLYSNGEWRVLENTGTQNKPWTPPEVGGISHFLQDQWLPQGRE